MITFDADAGTGSSWKILRPGRIPASLKYNYDRYSNHVSGRAAWARDRLRITVMISGAMAKNPMPHGLKDNILLKHQLAAWCLDPSLAAVLCHERQPRSIFCEAHPTVRGASRSARTKHNRCCDARQCGEHDKARHRSLDQELRRDPDGRLRPAGERRELPRQNHRGEGYAEAHAERAHNEQHAPCLTALLGCRARHDRAVVGRREQTLADAEQRERGFRPGTGAPCRGRNTYDRCGACVGTGTWPAGWALRQ
jgi:hypothetical protein